MIIFNYVPRVLEQDSRARKREGNSYQDAGEAGGETAGDCLDLDEEKGGI